MRKKGMLQWFMRKKDISVFWIHLFMMLCVLSLAVVTMLLSNHLSARALMEENLKKQQIALNQNATNLTREIYAAAVMPDVVETSPYFDHVRMIKSGTLPDKYAYILKRIATSLKPQQVYFWDASEECLIYLRGTNSICWPVQSFPVAEDCFESSVLLSDTETDTIMELLRTRGQITLLPMQEVQFSVKKVQCMPMITSPVDSSVAAILFFSEQTVQSFFDLNSLPEGTRLRIERQDGTLLYDSQPDGKDHGGRTSILTSELEELGLRIALMIPNDWHREVLRPSRLTGALLMGITVLIGVGLCFLFSHASVKPFRELIVTHAEGAAQEKKPNEIAVLDGLLLTARQKTEKMQGQLLAGLVNRLLSGGVITEEDEKQLKNGLPITLPWRVALLNSTATGNQLLQSGLLEQTGTDPLLQTMISRTETGFLLPADQKNLFEFTASVEELRRQLGAAGCELRCGVSAPVSEVSECYVAVRQARITLPQENSTGLFRLDAVEHRSLSWTQHERLHQSILFNNEEKTLEFLEVIAAQTRQRNARGTFYNVRFVIASAAEELQLDMKQCQETEYDEGLLARENILRLRPVIKALFRSIREKWTDHRNDLKTELISWLRENYADANLCLSMAAEALSQSEKQISDLVRQATGKSFNEYVLQLRMEQSAELLQHTRLKVGEIYLRCGFQADSTFFRVFKNYYGITPNQYRKRYGQQRVDEH